MSDSSAGPPDHGGPALSPHPAFRRLTHSLGWRLVVILIPSLVVLLAGTSWFSLELHRKHLTSFLEERAVGMGETIISSTHSSMLENDRRHLSDILDNIARREAVVALRLVNAQGRVMYSQNAEEVGRVSDLRAPVCQGCHAGSEVHAPASLRDGLVLYHLPSGEGALGLGVPVLNAPECASADCHVHPSDQRVLGILDLELSTAPLDIAVHDARAQMAGFALLTVLLISGVIGMLAWRLVHRPLRPVLEGIRNLGAGDLTHRVRDDLPGEAGELAGAFNVMSERLEEAQAELEDWNRTLEAKVREKTRELERTRDQMVFTEKMASLGKLAAIVAHELNNPLAGILVYAKLARRRLPKLAPPPTEGANGLREIDDTLATIETETARCGEIVKNLLLFSRRGGTRREPADLNLVINRAVRLVQHQADLASVSTRLDLAADLPPVVCDSGEIQQALLAAVMNGLDAMPEGGTLTIRTRRVPERDGVRIEIEDSGSGIPDEIRNKIFEPFFSTKAEGKGTGLGLSVMYGIVQRHHGTITFDSAAGKGTVFRLFLPCRSEEDVAGGSGGAGAASAAHEGGKEVGTS
jgi:two-component system, NtrC family, sensor kinase